MLQEGDKVPAFVLETDDRGPVSPRDFAGKTWVIYFYPKDNTPGCTREAIAFSAAKKSFERIGVTVVGVSKDSVKSHGSFREKQNLSIALASDPDLAVHRAFGTYGEKMMYGKPVMGTIRSTFVIGPDGRVAKAYPSVKVDGHAEDVLAVAKAVASGTYEGAEARTPAAPKAGAKTAGAKKTATTTASKRAKA
jgi:peroxiredoxin Q/BCP